MAVGLVQRSSSADPFVHEWIRRLVDDSPISLVGHKPMPPDRKQWEETQRRGAHLRSSQRSPSSMSISTTAARLRRHAREWSSSVSRRATSRSACRELSSQKSSFSGFIRDTWFTACMPVGDWATIQETGIGVWGARVPIGGLGWTAVTGRRWRRACCAFVMPTDGTAGKRARRYPMKREHFHRASKASERLVFRLRRPICVGF